MVEDDLFTLEKAKTVDFEYLVTHVTPTETNRDGKYEFPVPKEIVTISYSLDGINYKPALTFEAKAGRWVGVKCGMYIRNISGKEGGQVRCESFIFE